MPPPQIATWGSAGCTVTTGRLPLRLHGDRVNATRELFRRTSIVFTKYPVLWLPLVLADVLRSLLQWFSQPMTRAVLFAAAPRSAIGGGISGLPSPSKIALITGGMSFVVTVLGLLLYLYALGVVARAVDADARTPARTPAMHFDIPAGLGKVWLQISGLALLFTLYSTGVINAVVLPIAMRSHMRPTSLQTLVWVCVLPVLAGILFVAVGPLRRYVLRIQEQPLFRQGPSGPYFLLLAGSAVVSTLASMAIRLLTGHPRIQPSLGLLLLQVVASAATAFPYAYAMTGLSISLPLILPEEEELEGAIEPEIA